MDDVFTFQDAKTPREAIFQALGAASVCWEDMSQTGVFNSTQAEAIGEALIAKLAEFGFHIGDT